VSTEEDALISFLKEIMHRRERLPSQLASDLGISHAAVSRWLSGTDIPNTKSCRKLAEYSGVPLQTVLTIANHLPREAEVELGELPEFRRYAHQKYPEELDDDLITMIEGLIERRRQRGIKKGPKVGKMNKLEAELRSYLSMGDGIH
jgi:transcriptional regulator with XRE-family HTH domain